MADGETFIDRGLLALASPGQKQQYKELLLRKRARQSVLDYALYDAITKVGKNRAKSYRHTVFLNDVFMALREKRLYKSGPGPASIIVDITPQDPHGRRVHPVTGEPVLYKWMNSMPPRIGKAIASDTPVMTPNGYVPHGSLTAGDVVFNATGAQVLVQAVTPSWKDEGYAVEFSDGSSIVTHSLHEWDVLCDREEYRNRKVPGGGTRRVERLETKDLLTRQRRSPKLPTTLPIQLPEQVLEVEPWLLGAWLGNGSTNSGQICCNGDDISVFEKLGKFTKTPSNCFVGTPKGLIFGLRSLGVLGNKHIPEQYFLGSEAQRRALLSGLMDTDGYSDGKTCEFSSTALSLALGVQRLAWSLGLKPSFKEGRSKLYGKDCGPKYRVTFATNQSNPCFTTPRKLGKLQKKSGPTVFARFVTGVRSVGRVEMKCIQVEGGQYLVGEGLIPTHNSFFFGRYVPAFCSTVSPTETLMYISYAASLAEEFTGSSRDTIDEHPELGATLDPGTKSTKEFKIYRYGGGMIARGLGGIPTGRGGHLLMDDLFQDGSDAMRETQRDYAWTQYTSALQTRVELECWTILNGTRWHEDDMHGRFMEREPDEWFITNLPAISFDEVNEDGVSVDPETGIPDALGRGPGEAICPELYPVSYYAGKQKLDPFWYEAEYLGKPSGISGNMFKGEHFKHYKKHVVTGDDGSQEINYELFTGGSTSEFVSEKDCVRFGIVDLAASDKQSADYTVMGVFDMDPWKRLFVREIVRERVTGDNHEDFLKENYVKYGLRVLGIEEASFGFTLIQTLIADPEQSMRIWPLTADKNKKVRAIPAAGLFKKGLIFIDRDADWRSKYESELKKFDRDSHDDQVDVTAYATRMRSILSAAPLPAPEAHKKTGFEGFLSRLADEDEPAEPNETVVICGG